MTRKGFIYTALLGLTICVSATASNYKVVNNQDDFYYGHISYAETKNDGLDPVVFREGRLAPETAILNLPLGPGDVIETTGARRTEIQFDNGTVVRLDLNSRLKIETILAQSLSTPKKMSNLVLEKGQAYVMFKKYSSLEIFQVVTPKAAVKLDHNSVALIRLTEDGNTDVQVERGKAFLLYGGDTNHVSQKRLNPNQRGVVTAEDKVELAEYEALSDFKAWNESLNAHFVELHEANYLPQPIRNVSRVVFEFAQKFGNMYGEWVWHDLYGYVWRPYLNDNRYPWGNWSPYINGSWTSYSGQMFWVPGEPWGWVPYHLGIWMWDKSKGWVWLPGSLFAPAWAVWEFYDGMYCWRPFYLYDWMYGFSDFWMTSLWAGYYGTGYVPGQNPYSPQPNSNIRYTVRKDQLKKSDSPALPMPKEMKKVFGATLAALKRSDPSLLASLEGLPRGTVAVKKGDFVSPSWQEKMVPFDRLAGKVEAAPPEAKSSPSRRSTDVSRDAALAIERSRVGAELRALTTASPRSQRQALRSAPADIEFNRGVANGGGRAAGASAFRFRDWNPDVKAAVRLGVEIKYSSRTNEVACPQLGLTSHQVSMTIRSTGSFGGFMPSGGTPSSPAGHSSSTGAASSSSGHPHSSGSSSGSRQKN